MALDINTLVPASLKAKNVATEEYVDTSVVNDIAGNNNSFAQRLGYADYAAMVAAANNGQTVINGGYINTELIEAGAITADMINTTNLIADNINSSSMIVGNRIVGSYIEGATIKASYLSLDKELIVLTDWVSDQPLGNSVLIDGEYRLPTISSINIATETNLTVSGSTYFADTGVYPYNSYSVDTNVRARAASPVISFEEEAVIISTTGEIVHFTLYVCDELIGSGAVRGTDGNTYAVFNESTNTTTTKGVTIQPQTANYTVSNPSGWPASVHYAKVSISACTTDALSWTTDVPIVRVVVTSGTYFGAGAIGPFSINNL